MPHTHRFPLQPFPAWRGQAVSLATQHHKENALSRPFAALGMRVVVPRIDTDQLGTFTGEVPREGSPTEVVRRKCLLGIEALGTRLGLASEGSFGPHPEIPFAPGATELLLFRDEELGLELVESLTTMETNFRHEVVRPDDDPGRFLRRVQFPSHALIVRPNEAPSPIYKGITDGQELRIAIERCAALSPDGRARMETDMRAHLNPTRMRVIRRLAFRLARRLATPCPSCGKPGFGMIDIVAGLPCAACGLPTQLVASEVWGCASCSHREVHPRIDGLRLADPGSCPSCNP